MRCPPLPSPRSPNFLPDAAAMRKVRADSPARWPRRREREMSRLRTSGEPDPVPRSCTRRATNRSRGSRAWAASPSCRRCHHGTSLCACRAAYRGPAVRAAPPVGSCGEPENEHSRRRDQRSVSETFIDRCGTGDAAAQDRTVGSRRRAGDRRSGADFRRRKSERDHERQHTEAEADRRPSPPCREDAPAQERHPHPDAERHHDRLLEGVDVGTEHVGAAGIVVRATGNRDARMDPRYRAPSDREGTHQRDGCRKNEHDAAPDTHGASVPGSWLRSVSSRGREVNTPCSGRRTRRS
jgi:hypothetical protein